MATNSDSLTRSRECAKLYTASAEMLSGLKHQLPDGFTDGMRVHEPSSLLEAVESGKVVFTEQDKAMLDRVKKTYELCKRADTIGLETEDGGRDSADLTVMLEVITGILSDTSNEIERLMNA